MIGTSFFYIGEITKSTSHFEQAIAHDTRERYNFSSLTHGTDSGVACQIWIAWNLWYLGYPEKALIKSNKACNLSQELSHPHSMVFALLLSSRVYQYRRESQTTKELAEKVISLSIEYGFPLRIAAGTFMRGWALAEQGQRAEGIALMHQGLENWQATGAQTNLTYFHARLSEMYGVEGEPVKGLGLINEALNYMAKSEERFCEAELYQIKGNLLSGQTHRDEYQAENCFQQALEVARKQQAKSLELRAAISMSRLWQSQGKKEDARNLLMEIYGWFTEGFHTADLKDAKALLDELS